MIDHRERARVAALEEPLRAKLTRALELIDGDGEQREANLAIHEVLEATPFPKFDAGPMPLPEELTPAQRTVAECLGRREGLRLSGRVIPNTSWKVRRWIGLDPPGVLERPVTFTSDGETRTEPLWRAMHAHRPKDDAFFRGLQLPIGERLEAFADLCFGHYNFTAFKLTWGDPQEIGSDLGDWARKVADQITVDERHITIRDVLWPVFLALVRAGVPIEPRWDALLPAGDGPLRRPTIECANAIPDGRRDPAIVAAVRRCGLGHPIVRAGLDLLPTFPSRGLVELIESNADSAAGAPKFSRITKKQLYARLEAIAAEHPIVAEALAGPPEAPVLRVVAKVEPKQVSDLTEVERKQLATSGKGYDGHELSVEQRLDPDPTNEETSFLGFLELLLIVGENGEPAYDAWLYMTDSGSIFRAGTTDLVAQIIQFGVECRDPGLRDGLRNALQSQPR